jgi:hypothetical protein
MARAFDLGDDDLALACLSLGSERSMRWAFRFADFTLPAVVLARSHLVGVLIEILPADPVMKLNSARRSREKNDSARFTLAPQ